jgi:hypothetical protein
MGLIARILDRRCLLIGKKVWKLVQSLQSPFNRADGFPHICAIGTVSRYVSHVAVVICKNSHQILLKSPLSIDSPLSGKFITCFQVASNLVSLKQSNASTSRRVQAFYSRGQIATRSHRFFEISQTFRNLAPKLLTAFEKCFTFPTVRGSQTRHDCSVDQFQVSDNIVCRYRTGQLAWRSGA